jgi:DNA-binding NtrC family response regulator
MVESDDVARCLLEETVRDAGYAVDAVASGEEALRLMERELYDVVLLDLQLPRMSGLSVLTVAATQQLDAQFIVTSGLGTVDAAVSAMKLGAYDYLAKPFRPEELLLTIERACRETELRREVARLRRRTTVEGAARLVGRSHGMKRLLDLIERVAPMRATVLISGETGTGKELVARSVHDLSNRARKPFVAVNCSALPESLLESELFGHVKGSFTGAVTSRRGLFEEADGGTLFLDEISTISAPIQVKLLRVLEERSIHRVGSSQPLNVDFRLITATNEDLQAKVEAGKFREDLFYRLNVFPVHVPPLRHRKEDIPLLANHFRLRFAQENSIDPPVISAITQNRMVEYDWPGNVRELENFIERSIILYAGAKEIRFEPPSAERREEFTLMRRAAHEGWSLEQLEREYILSVLERTGGHQGRAADVLGIDRRTLYRKLKAMGVRVRHDARSGTAASSSPQLSRSA